LEDEAVDIRLRAAVTCCKLFMRDPILHQRSLQSIELINDVLEKLLTVGIADMGM
jgi:FKBP12-rapamycin complex-associated protein